jgi:hypothetical protein
MATLLALVERLDDGPSDSVPPEVFIDVDGSRDSGFVPAGPEETIVTPMMFDDDVDSDDGPALFGMINSLVPSPPASSIGAFSSAYDRVSGARCRRRHARTTA